MDERIIFKKKVIDKLLQQKKDQLAELKKEQRSRLESANVEDIDKGDLVESPKEQMMDEINLQAYTVDNLSTELVQLQAIDSEQIHDTVSQGALVRTNVGYFMIGVSHPFVSIDGKRVTGLSTHAPLYQKMKELRKHAEFHLGNIEYVILDIV
ncbi:hypothetical protein [Catalinimonas niigatensis]|uniref:hypothetical protein n=1 Tax=Catalinimonas niigatensis TaxID=1397264 RepID=UPI00266589AB|nr:hypothetical protein [Catalinimonas niigatensis]WPP48735.1 hypothetical protein PZB72_18890 [Catalinimonas niigatensis]